MSYRVGLVGTGGIARAHGRACQQIAAAELVAVCDVSATQLVRYGEEFGVEARYTDLDAMLREAELDIAIICTWGAFHAETGIQICNSGRVKAVLCEKPFTQGAAQAAAFAAAGRKNRVLVAEAFKFRHHPMHLRGQGPDRRGRNRRLSRCAEHVLHQFWGAAHRAHARVELALQQGQRRRQHLRLGLLQYPPCAVRVWRGARAGVCRPAARARDRRCRVHYARLFGGPHRANRRGFLMRSARSTRKFPGTAGCCG